MGLGNSKPLDQKQSLNPDNQKWYFNPGEGCTACPSQFYQNCQSKFGTGWSNCGESGCSGTGCEAICCLSPEQQAINRQKAAEAAAAAAAAAEAARLAQLRSTCSTADSTGKSNLLSNPDCKTWCNQHPQDCDAAKQTFCTNYSTAKECSCIYGDKDPAYQQWVAQNPQLIAPMPCVQPACRQTDLVNMLIPTVMNTANIKCPDLQLQQIQNSGLNIGSSIGVQTGNKSSSASSSVGSSMTWIIVIAALFLIMLIIIIAVIYSRKGKKESVDENLSEYESPPMQQPVY